MMLELYRFTARKSFVTGPALLLAATALAQDSNATPDTNSPTQLPEVTVTAQKEPAKSQSLPVSVTPVTRQIIADADIQSVKEASIYAPNTFINEFTARALSNPFFRGIGGGPLNPAVTTFIDGVPQLNGYSSSIELIDLQQIEFVRGPQGALFGRNTAGGLINITSRLPSTIWQGAAEGSYGNYDLRDVRATVSGPLLKNEVAMSLSGGYSARQGYTVNDFNGQDVDHREGGFGKGQLLWEVNDRLEVRLIGFGEHDYDGDYALGDLDYIRAHPNHVNHDFTGGFNHRDLASGTLLVNYRGEEVDVASISGGVWWKNEGLTDLDYSTVPGNTRDNVEEQHQFTQEFRVSSAKAKPVKIGDSVDMSWQSGVFLFTQDYQQNAVNNFLTLNPFPPPPILAGQSTSTADLDDWGVGVYGQVTFTAWEKLDLSAGVRYDYEDKRADLGSGTSVPPFPPTQGQSSPSDTFNQVSPQFALAYHLSPDQTAYASAARGYRAGGFNPPPASSQEYGPEHSWNYEVGYKSFWLDHKLQTALALFYIDWRNMQLNQPVAGAPGQFYVANAGAAYSEGVEFDVKYRPCSGCDLFGSVGYTAAHFLSDSTAYNPNLPGVQSIGGNRLPYTPTYTGNMGTQLTWSPCSAATLYARAEVTVYGDFLYDASNAQGQDTYSLADFRGGVRGSHWFVEGWARNAFDSHYVPIAIQYGQLGAPSGYVGETGAPVTYGLSAGINF